jgi:hypothetical protein
MAGHGPIGRLGRSLADVEGVAELASTLGEALGSGIAHRPPGAQATLQLPAERAAALDEQRQVDRLVRHPQHQILRGGQRQPAGDLLGRPPQGQLGLDHRPQPRLDCQLGRLGPLGPPKRGGVGRLGPVATRPPLLASSRDTVDGARPSRLAIARQESPAATPRLISSRSTMLRHRGARWVGAVAPRRSGARRPGSTAPACRAGGRSAAATHLAATVPRPRPVLLLTVPGPHPPPPPSTNLSVRR